MRTGKHLQKGFFSPECSLLAVPSVPGAGPEEIFLPGLGLRAGVGGLCWVSGRKEVGSTRHVFKTGEQSRATPRGDLAGVDVVRVCVCLSGKGQVGGGWWGEGIGRDTPALPRGLWPELRTWVHMCCGGGVGCVRCRSILACAQTSVWRGEVCMLFVCARGRGVCVCVCMKWEGRGSSTGKAGEIRKEEREFACEIQGLGFPWVTQGLYRKYVTFLKGKTVGFWG